MPRDHIPEPAAGTSEHKVQLWNLQSGGHLNSLCHPPPRNILLYVLDPLLEVEGSLDNNNFQMLLKKGKGEGLCDEAAKFAQ